MWLMLQQEAPDDFIIATGETHSLADFAERSFSSVGLDWRDHVISDPALFRPTDIEAVRADPSHAAKVLGWRATQRMPEVVTRMMAQTGDEDATRSPA